jgi:hypothetical protein
MKNNQSTVVIGYVENYTFSKIKTWYETLRSVYDGDIALIYKNISCDTLNELKQRNIICIDAINLHERYNLDRNLSPYNIKYIALYLCIIKDILNYDSYLFTDSTDVYFQENPFSIDHSNVILTCENNTYGNCTTNETWIRVGWGEDQLNKLNGKEIINSGVIIGTKQNLILFLKIFVSEMSICLSRVYNYPTFDQSAFNCVVYKHTPDFVTVLNKEYAIHLSGYKFNDLKIFNNKIYDKNHKPYCIIHQYDCIEELNR